MLSFGNISEQLNTFAGGMLDKIPDFQRVLATAIHAEISLNCVQ